MIKNFKELALNPNRTFALNLLNEGLKSVLTKEVIRNNFSFNKELGQIKIKDREFYLKKTGRLIILAIGKCAYQAAGELRDILKGVDFRGIVIDILEKKEDNLFPLKYFQGSHPFPSKDNIRATKELINLLKESKEDDLIISIISGGGSTLLVQPTGNFSVETEESWLKELFEKGATISEINTLRKHLSWARGGWWAEYAFPAKMISLIFSDVIGDDFNFIASGPTVLDRTSKLEAMKIANYYELTNFEEDYLVETLKDPQVFSRIENILMVSNEFALQAMSAYAENQGYQAIIKTNTLSGEARYLGAEIITELSSVKKQTVFIYGGESTVTITGQGQGGRNQELSLGALSVLRENQLVISLASDGFDNTSNAGAIADQISLDLARKHSLEIKSYLLNNDSYTFWQKINQGIQTGSTGINIADLIVAIKF